jgi:hypothetical protein
MHLLGWGLGFGADKGLKASGRREGPRGARKDEQKKPESSGDEVEQVGPYQFQEQVPQDEYSHGKLYRATHETSGAPALVLKPAAEDEQGSVPLTDWRVRLSSSASPKYVALEVEHTPWSVAPDRQSVESLVCTFEDVREAVGSMDQALHAPPVRQASRWRCPAPAGFRLRNAPVHRKPWPTRANAFCPSRCRALLSPVWTVATAPSPAEASHPGPVRGA